VRSLLPSVILRPWLRRLLSISVRSDWNWSANTFRPTLELSNPPRPGWYLITILIQSEQRRCHGRLLPLQERSLISGRLRRRIIRIRGREKSVRFELLGVNSQVDVIKLTLVPQPLWRVKRLVSRKLSRLHPLYSTSAIPHSSFPLQWRDYNRLLASRSIDLVGYEDWLERVEIPMIKSQVIQADLEKNKYLLAESKSNEAYPKIATWLWGDRSDQAAVSRSIESINAQLFGLFNLLPEDVSLTSGCANTWLMLIAVGDCLAPHALRRFREVLYDFSDAEIVYADEDLFGSQGRRYSPNFKPAWNQELFYANPYFSNSWWIRSDLALKACQNLQDAGVEVTIYEFLLELAAISDPTKIVHVPDVLYHKFDCSLIDGSAPHTAAAVQACLQRHGQDVEVSLTKIGCHRLAWPLPSPCPLVSIIIPTRDHADLLHRSLDSIYRLNNGQIDFEILVIDNGSSDPIALEFLDELEKQGSTRILRMPGPFNYAYLNNEAVKHANGEVIFFVNNDVEVINPEWMKELVSQAVRPGVGAVGAKLLFDDHTIQHAGVVLGIGGIAGHAHKYLPADSSGYQNRLQMIQQVSAVTAAVLAIRKCVFVEVGGFDEEAFAVSYNDVDLCLRLQQRGYRNVYSPDAVLYHHESRSRGEPSTPAEYDQWQRERALMTKRWGSLLSSDPFYSPYLSLLEENFSLWLETPSSLRARGRTAPSHGIVN